MLYIPEDLEEVIFSHETFDYLKTLWTKYNLNDDEQVSLGSETGLYLSGMTKVKDFAPRLMYALNKDKNTANSIKDDIDNNIVSKARKSFDEVQSGRIKGSDIIKTGDESDYGIKRGENTDTDSAQPQERREDILRGIEENKSEPTVARDPEGEEFDQQLDEIIRKSKQSVIDSGDPNTKPTLKAITPLQSDPEQALSKTSSPTHVKATQKPIPKSYGEKDPYREDI